MHLIIDGYGSDREVMASRELVYDLLDRYPGEIGMTKIAPPYVFRYVGVKPEDWGISGIVPIAESHISIHTFVERCMVNIDVFSCKEFDFERIVRDLKDRLKLVRTRSYLLRRGLECPNPIEPCLPIMEIEAGPVVGVPVGSGVSSRRI
ncbi:MAG: S-adenosylmethionine decarboxylase [Chloroflexi bacterium]|nr:S-adenosylmethionine decarboxylase [Chloroflexota bacterium]